MAFIRCELNSQKLGMQTSVQIVFPDNAIMSELKVVYILHGLSDNCTCWQRFVPVELFAREYSAAFVMPEVNRSFYTDMKYGLKYFSFIHEELLEFCERTFGFSKKKENRYVMGQSMGGYGALKCALTQPFKYAGVGAFSSVACIDKFPSLTDNPNFKNEWQAITGGESFAGTKSDLNLLAVEASNKIDLPEIYMSCGTEDFLLELNRDFNKHLNKLDIYHSYEEWSGGHTWQFWQQSLTKACDKLLK